jgi:hypothetical protein
MDRRVVPMGSAVSIVCRSFVLGPFVLGLGLVSSIGCGATDGPDSHGEAHEDCADAINQLRASAGLSPLSRWTANEGCADEQAASDGESGTAHGAFGKCNELAQNECPDYRSVGDIVDTSNTKTGCLALMWAEGPGSGSGHGHYANMTSTAYTQVCCGYYTTPGGGVWSVQDFR